MKYQFVAGDVVCGECGHKPEDRWDPKPEGFYKHNGWWFCRECIVKLEEGMGDVFLCDVCDKDVAKIDPYIHPGMVCEGCSAELVEEGEEDND